MRTLKEFLKTAIKAESCVKKLYEIGRNKAKDQATKKFLDCLVKEELQHEKLLASIMQNKLYDLDVEIPNDKIFDTALNAHGDYEEHCDETWTVEQILDIALQRENHARQQYEIIARNCKIPEMKELLENMAKEEADHLSVIDREYKIVTRQMGYEF